MAPMTSTWRLARLLITALAVLLGLAPALLRAAPAGTGFIDSARLSADGRELALSGWAAPERANVFTTQLTVRLGDREIYRGRLERFDRPDVVEATGRADWLWSGWRIRIALPPQLAAGPQPLSASMRLGDGESFELGILDGARSIAVPPPAHTPIGRRWLLAIAIGLAIAAGALLAGRSRKVFAWGVALVFVALVGAGLTGSSLGLLLDRQNLLVHDGVLHAGSPQPVRSDEWEVATPLALSQASHQPPFPVVNRNLGPDGQNMLVVGMTGLPVAHLSTLAKPATWGYFALDLRRALAWAWWFPFFACFGALWLLIMRLFQVEWRLAAGLALTAAASPYAAVFSGWPSYTLFFPAAALLAADAALRTVSGRHAALLGALSGLAAAGFALVLYPAWQISLAYLFAPLALAVWWRDRRSLAWGRPQWLAAALALAVAAGILLAWWLDARDAVASVRGTVYPGQRSTEAGGDIDRWFLLKGLLSPVTMYRDSSLLFGASDAGSVPLLLVPALGAMALRWWSQRRIDAVGAALAGYLAVALGFMYGGFGTTLARWTLWGSTTAYRFDLALGTAQLLILAWLASPPQHGGSVPRWAPALLALAAAAHAALLVPLLPPALAEIVPAGYVVLVLIATAAAGWLLAHGRHGGFFALYGALTLAATLPFNPLSTAPSAVTPAAALTDAVAQLPAATAQRRGIAVLGARTWALSLPAAGVPVANSVFHYPQPTLWRALDPQGAQQVLYNRYQRLMLVAASRPMPRPWRIDSPRLDEVQVTIDAARFDFRLLGARGVIAAPADGAALRANPGLRLVREDNQWALFEVLP